MLGLWRGRLCGARPLVARTRAVARLMVGTMATVGAGAVAGAMAGKPPDQQPAALGAIEARACMQLLALLGPGIQP
eukprot:10235273-Alexandrium_andersonii.AAC.1